MVAASGRFEIDASKLSEAERAQMAEALGLIEGNAEARLDVMVSGGSGTRIAAGGWLRGLRRVTDAEAGGDAGTSSGAS